MNIKTGKKTLQKITLLMALFLMMTVQIQAQTSNGSKLVHGKVYNFVSVGLGGKSLSSSDRCDFGQAGTNQANPHQLWIAVEGTGDNAGQFALRNLGNGLYLSSSEKAGAAWSLIPTIALSDASYNYCVKLNDNSDIYVMCDQPNGNGDHCLQLEPSSVVCGNKSNTKTQFRINEVHKTEEEIKTQLDKVAHFEKDRTEYYRALIYEQHLNKIFTDKACTQLNSSYAAMSVETLEKDATFNKLPVTLRQMVKKIKSNNWEEENANKSKPKWDDRYARKFRVQMYEPYSDPHEAGLALRIQPHSVLNNPTGIYASKGDTLYVMVEGEIKEGSDLYFSSYQGYNRPEGNARRGTKLKEGLNIVPYNRDSIGTFICYNVETFKNNVMTGRKLSDYKDLKIHIEGGSINGYYNKMGDALFQADKNADWDYYEARANMPFITILGKYQVLQLYKDSMRSNDGKVYPGLSSILNDKVKVEDVIDAWDKLMFNQRLTLGVLSKAEIEEAKEKFPTLDDRSRGIYGYIGDDSIAAVDYSDAYRVHGMSLGQLTGYMVGSNGYSGYNISTFEAITVGLASKDHKNFGNIWGAAHEIGHQHQAMLHMNGLKESSNNIFSNVAVWFDGKATSNMADGALENLLKVYNREDGDFFHTTLGVQMHLYYKLWLYYHLAGKNNKFYPRLFEMLRRNPMNITTDQDGAQSLLHFYKMCSKAAGEDLTEFFRAHCFFTPLKQRHVADYTSSDYTLTQEQVDAAIAEVKSWNLPLNRNIIFINDCAGKTVYSHDGVTPRHIYDGKLNADVGMYTDFIRPEEGKVDGVYRYHFTEGKIVMSGAKGGVGFLAYDDEGMLQAFSDRYSFMLSERARKKLSTNSLRFYVIDGAGNLTEIKGEDKVGEQRELLRTAISDAKTLLTKVDERNRRIGFFRKEAVANLEKIIAQAEQVYEDRSKEQYIATSYLLNEECRKIKEAKDARITFVPNSTYLLECQYAANKFVNRESDNKMVLKTDETEAAQWLFEMVGENKYQLKHVATNKYMSAAESSRPVTLVEKGNAGTYSLETLDDNFFALGSGKGYLNWAHNAGHLQGWAKIEGTQSRWRLLLISVADAEKKYQDLAKSADMAEDLIRKNSQMKTVELQTTNEQATGYLYCNAPAANNQTLNGSPENGYNLLDKDVNTFLHTISNENADSRDGLDHYLKVDMQGQNLPVVSMHYTTRNADSQERPRVLWIEGSKDNQTFTPIMKIEQGLPRHRTTDFGTAFLDGSYRYLRFMVKATYGGKTAKGHPFFSMSSFGITTPVLLEKYSTAQEQWNALLTEIIAARKVLEAGREQNEQLVSAKEKLDAAYQAFDNACQTVDNLTMQSKKSQLETLIAKTEVLLKEVANVNYEENRQVASAVTVALQATDNQKKAHISTNADQNKGGNGTDGGGIAALLDKNTRTFLHTRYNGAAVNEDHHILVQLADKDCDAEFDFHYACRDNNGGPHPTEIRVEQSVDGTHFTPIHTFTKDADTLPQLSQKYWHSPKLAPQGAYRYLRFVVPKSSNTKQHSGHYFFSMSEFGLRQYEYRTEVNVSKKEELTCVNDSLVIDAELSKVTAQALTGMTADVSEMMLEEQLADLQQVYDSLLKAKEASEPYNNLKAYSETPHLPLFELKAGDKVGQWQADCVEAYNQAYRKAAHLLSYKGAEAAEYTEALTAWKRAYEGLSVVQPKTDKLYTLRKVKTSDNTVLFVDKQNVLHQGNPTDKLSSVAVWKFVKQENKLQMQSLHTTALVANLAEGSKLVADQAADIQLLPMNNEGLVCITTNGNAPKAATEGWYIEEVENPSSVGFNLSVSKYGYSGLYLEYDVQLPQGVTAYTASEITGNTVMLTPIAEKVIPAQTAVIVKAEPGTYRMAFTESVAPETSIEKAPILSGSSVTEYKKADVHTSYYLFGVKNETVGLYKAWLEYNADGSITDGNKGTDQGGHFKISANKVYLTLPDNGQAAALTFRFDTPTTDIEASLTEESNATIYDLQGRRLEKVRQAGLYIVNGRKVWLNPNGKRISWK